MTERLIDIRHTELTPTLRALSDAGGTTDDAAWIRRGENAQSLISLIRQLQENPWPSGTRPVLLKLWEKVNETTIRVNLDYPLNLPFRGAQPEFWSERQTGWVTVELRDGELYVDDKKIVHFLAEEQRAGAIRGHSLCTQVLQLPGQQHPNVMEALVEAWDSGLFLVPESWKVDSQGRCLCTHFWQIGFRLSVSTSCVPCMCWNGTRWSRNRQFFSTLWYPQQPAAVSES